jgi:two-component system sensor histidine kinase UhpB
MRSFISSVKPVTLSGDLSDDENRERARAVQVIVWTLIVVGTLTLIVAPLIPGSGPFSRYLFNVCALYVLGTLLVLLNARGKTRIASVLLVIGCSFVVTWLALTAGGMRSSAVQWYVIAVAIAGLLLGETAGFLAAGLVSVLSLGLVIIELVGQLPPDPVTHSPILLWFGVLWSVIAIASVQYLAARTVKDALHLTRKELQERKRIEEDLRKHETMLSSILNAIPQSVFWKDRRGVYLGCNQVFAEAAGLDRPDLVVGKTDFDLPWPRNEAEAYRRDDEEVIEQRRAKVHIVEPLQRADGTRLWIDTSKVPLFDANGQVYGVLGVYEDVTGQKQAQEALQRSEALFHAVVDNSHDAVVLLDDGRRLKYVSPSVSRIGGYAPQEIEETYGPLYTHPDDRASTESKFREALQAPGTSLSLEYRIRHKLGYWVWIEVRIINMLNDPNVQSLVLNIRDITGRKRSDEALQDSMEQLHTLATELEHAREQERKTTAREVHDELGQILTAIRMAVEKAGRTGELEGAVGGEGTHLLLQLVDQGIHAVQRIAARLRPGILDDLGLLPALEWRVEEFQKQSDVLCSLSLPETEPVIDEDRSTALFRILGELLTNVGRHAKASQVAIALRETPEEFVMSVCDNGVGMADGALQSPHALGFKGIRERLYPFGGSVIVQPGPDSGTEIVIHLPRKARRNRSNHD